MTSSTMITTTSGNTLNLNLGGGGIYSTAYTTTLGTAAPPMYVISTSGTYYSPPLSVDWLTMPGVIDTVIEQLVTRVKTDERVVVCVDDDLSWEQVTEIQHGLSNNKIPGIVIRGARAGTGYGGGYISPTPEEARVDVLARIGEIWALNPNLRLTDLLQWYDGQDMSNEEFATSVEVHFQKVTNGIHGRPE